MINRDIVNQQRFVFRIKQDGTTEIYDRVHRNGSAGGVSVSGKLSKTQIEYILKLSRAITTCKVKGGKQIEIYFQQPLFYLNGHINMPTWMIKWLVSYDSRYDDKHYFDPMFWSEGKDASEDGYW